MLIHLSVRLCYVQTNKESAVMLVISDRLGLLSDKELTR